MFASALLVVTTAHAADPAAIPRIPRQVSLEAGARQDLSAKDTTFANDAPRGFSVMGDYAWQLRGFGGTKAAVYISVPLDYTRMPAADAGSDDMSLLVYGWTVRHELRAREKASLVPFLGYGLFLSQASFSGIDGQIFGHCTHFELGSNLYHDGSRFAPFVKLEYDYTRYPSLGSPHSMHVQALELRIGTRIRLGESAKPE